MKVRVEAAVQPTEDPQKVAAACQTILPGEVQLEEGRAVVEGTDLRRLRQRIWELRIIDTMRGAFLGGCNGKSLSVLLSKQGAAAGKVSVPIGAALGDIRLQVTIEDADRFPDAEALCWWLCPETKDGEIVGPTD